MRNITFFHIATVTPNWVPYDKSSFPPAIYHKPIATSMVTLDATDYNIGSIVSRGIKDLEHEGASLLMTLFQDLADSASDAIFMFTGESFVLPVLNYNILHYGIVNPMLSSPLLTRTSDISRVLSQFGDSKAFVSLSDYAVVIGLNKRPFLDVAKAFQAGDIDTIVDRLELDVMLIAALYFRTAFCSGKMSVKCYRNAAKQLLRSYYDKSKFIRGYMTKQDVMRHIQVY